MRVSPVSKAFIILPAILGMVACANPKSGSPNSSMESNQINAGIVANDPKLTPAQKAEKIAKSAEQLLTYQGFAYATEVADLALKQDSKNLRAQLIKALVGPIEAQRGLAVRIKPLAEKTPQTLDQYHKMMGDLEQKTPNSTVKSFLVDGSGDIQSEADIQAYIDSVANSFKAIREFAKKNKSAEITMMTSDAFYNSMLSRHSNSCRVEKTGPYNYSYNCPSNINMLEVTLNRGDMEALQQSAAGMELYFSMLGSYDLTGSIKVAMDNQDKNAGKKVSPEEILNQLLKDSRFGKIREGDVFRKIKGMGVDVIAGIRWVMNNQNTLCPMGVSDPRNRLGALYNHGICIDQASSSQLPAELRKVEDVLNGATVQTVIGNLSAYDMVNGYPSIQVEIKPSALLDKPIDDIRSLTPVQFNDCGRLSSVSDATVGGLFPNKDANKALKVSSQCPTGY